jgi:hypothetical protein
MLQYPGATWTSPHIYGAMGCNHYRKLFYVNIPKCASMWMREYIAMHGHTCEDTWVGGNFTIDNLENYTPIILLRDPVKRWASHSPASDFIVKNIQNSWALDDVFINLKNWTTDEHMAPQTDFIAGLNLDRAVFFYCNTNLSKNVEHYFHTHGFNVAPPDPTNKRPETLDKQSRLWEEILNTPKYFETFKQHFQKDYDLINSVNFYTHHK